MGTLLKFPPIWKMKKEIEAVVEFLREKRVRSRVYSKDGWLTIGVPSKWKESVEEKLGLELDISIGFRVYNLPWYQNWVKKVQIFDKD